MTRTAARPTRILVPLDGSPFSEHALAPALEIARRAGAELRLVRVHLPFVTGLEIAELNPEREQTMRDSESAWLEQIGEQCSATLRRPVSSVLLRGEVAPALAEYAEAWGADLVVMTTHARGPAGRFWLGSIADRLLHTLHQPLLLIPPGADRGQPPEFRQILVPLDGSARAEAVVAEAQKIGNLFGSAYNFYEAVVEPTPVIDPTGTVVMIQETEPLQERMAEARIQLERMATATRSSGAAVSVVVAGANGAAPGILAAASAVGADLITLATRGRAGVQRFWFGSVADSVLRRSPVPVLVVRPAP